MPPENILINNILLCLIILSHFVFIQVLADDKNNSAFPPTHMTPSYHLELVDGVHRRIHFCNHTVTTHKDAQPQFPIKEKNDFGQEETLLPLRETTSFSVCYCFCQKVLLLSGENVEDAEKEKRVWLCHENVESFYHTAKRCHHFWVQGPSSQKPK